MTEDYCWAITQGFAGSSVIGVWISAGMFSMADDMYIQFKPAPDLLERKSWRVSYVPYLVI
jgi:hypothetical protein